MDLSLAVTGGFHDRDSAVKALLAGADVIHLCSVLLSHGEESLARIKQGIYDWLEEKEYESVKQMKGSLSRSCAINPAELEHSNYIDVIKSYQAAEFKNNKM